MALPYFDEIESKIVTLDQLLPIVKKLKQEGKTIVTNNGSYDIIHIGHILGLFESKKQGDILIIGVNSDSSVKGYKGPKRPINPQEWRVRTLAALQCVDYVFTFDEPVPMPWLEKIQPDIHTNGSEYGTECIEAQTLKKIGARLHLLPMVEGVKTTALIDKILDVYQ